MTDRPSLLALVFIFLTVGFTVLGQILVKQGMLAVGKSPAAPAALPGFALAALTNVRVVLGLSCAVVAALAWIVAISHADLSFAYPFMGLAIVLVLALSPLIFGERILVMRWLGVLVVCAGLWIAARSS
jgi:drug/metabolite transporter (DMT)-like permease